MIIAIDFDGTVVEHRYPQVGRDLPGVVETLKALVKKRHELILFTMRSGIRLDEAVEWFAERNIPLFGVQTNPEQSEWTDSPKAYAHLYIDDAALGCPLIHPPCGNRPYVDWAAVSLILRTRGLL